MRITLLSVPLCFGVAAAIIVPLCMVKRPAKPVPVVAAVSPADSVARDTTHARQVVTARKAGRR